jgi:hypothetical protein
MRPDRPAASFFNLRLQGAMEQAEAGYEGQSGPHARDVGAMFDETGVMADRHAELHADQARLQAELERERAELARARSPYMSPGWTG